jgi:fibronectin type 3 domain-containing protein
MRKPGVLILGVLLLGTAVTVQLYLRHAPRPHSVTLRWHPPADGTGPEVVAYNIYRSTSPGGPYARLASGVQNPTYKDELVHTGANYYYVVRSVDKFGHESLPSNEANATIPTR